MAAVQLKMTNLVRGIAQSQAIAGELAGIAAAVLAAAQNDPNPEYVASLQIRQFITTGRLGRVSYQVGAAPVLGDRVEAKRGTLARALGAAGS